MFEVIVIIIAGISLRHKVDIFCQRLDALELLEWISKFQV